MSQPEEIRVLSGGATVRITWNDGDVQDIAADVLRAGSPAADAGVDDPAAYPGITVKDANNVGAYAVRFVFSDGHNTGLYTWDRLAELAAKRR